MKILKLLLIIFCLSGCGISASEYDDLKSENILLKNRVDSLSTELNDLRFGAKNLLIDAKSKIDSKEFISSKDLLFTLIKKYPASTEANAARGLLKTINPKVEYQYYSNAEKSKDAALYQVYIEQYPKGRYYTKARNYIRNYQKRQSITSSSIPYTSELKATNPNSIHKSKRNYRSSSGIRVGAICCDGTQSSATGRGACSHHGGVCEWLYE